MKTRMKWAVLLSAFWIGLFSQTFAQEMSRQDYLDKSRNQKTTGFILLGGGVAMIAVGSILFADDAVDTAISCTNLNCSSGSGMESGMVISAVGGLAILGSIPVFISSHKNARKAAQLSFRNEPTTISKYAANIPRSIPSLRLSIPLD